MKILDLPQLKSQMVDVLSAEQSKRKQRQKHSQDWATDERMAMHQAVNQKRRKLGKTPISLFELERQERLAYGHSDYTEKFALYCAQLVLSP